jgi:hypothetical protein
LQAVGPVHRWLDPATWHGAAFLDQIVGQQAQIVAYSNDYVLLMMRLPRKAIKVAAE